LFFYTYYVGIAAIARWPAPSISIELLLKHLQFYRNAIITHATQKSLDYFIIRFLSFYEINPTKAEKIVYYTRFIRRTVTLVLPQKILTTYFFFCEYQMIFEVYTWAIEKVTNESGNKSVKWIPLRLHI
jgi:hypothetical protein